MSDNITFVGNISEIIEYSKKYMNIPPEQPYFSYSEITIPPNNGLGSDVYWVPVDLTPVKYNYNDVHFAYLCKPDCTECERIKEKQRLLYALNEESEDTVLDYSGNGFIGYYRFNIPTDTNVSEEKTNSKLTDRHFKLCKWLEVNLPWCNNKLFKHHLDVCEWTTSVSLREGLKEAISSTGDRKLDIITPNTTSLGTIGPMFDHIVKLLDECEEATTHRPKIYFQQIHPDGTRLLEFSDYLDTNSEYYDNLITEMSRNNIKYLEKMLRREEARGVEYMFKMGTLENMVPTTSKDRTIVKESVVEDEEFEIGRGFSLKIIDGLKIIQTTQGDGEAYLGRSKLDWINIFRTYYQIGLYDFICIKTGGENCFDKDKWDITITQLNRDIETETHEDGYPKYPIWEPKKVFSGSFPSKVKANVRNLKTRGRLDDLFGLPVKDIRECEYSYLFKQ